MNSLFVKPSVLSQLGQVFGVFPQMDYLLNIPETLLSGHLVPGSWDA
jgi:hypothetical protein